MEVHGHRGARAVLPENTLAAFRHALQAGVEGIELDVAMTRDDQVVVVHDLRVNPDLCTGPDGKPAARVPIRSLTLDQVRTLDCGSRPNPRFPRQQAIPGERIPTLEEVLSLVRAAGRPIRVDLEVKSAPAKPDESPPPGRWAEVLPPLVAGQAGIVVMSFDHRILAALRARVPPLAVSPLVPEVHPDYVAEAKALGAVQVAPHHEWITPEDVAALHAAGVRVVPWTANEPAAWDRLVRLGVDGIITDDPAGLKAWLGGRR